MREFNRTGDKWRHLLDFNDVITRSENSIVLKVKIFELIYLTLKGFLPFYFNQVTHATSLLVLFSISSEYIFPKGNSS